MIIHGSNQVNEKVRRRLCTTTVWTLLFQKMMVVAATDLRWLSMKLPPPSDAAIHEDEELTTSNSVSSLLLLFGVIQFMASSHGKFLEMIWYL